MSITTFHQPSPDAELIRCRWWGRVTPIGVAAKGSATIRYTGPLPVLDDDPEEPVGLYWQDVTIPISVEQKAINGVAADFGYFEVYLPATNDPDLTGGGWPYECQVTLTNAKSPRSFQFWVDRSAPNGMVLLNRGEVTTAAMGGGSAVPVVTWADQKATNDAVFALSRRLDALVQGGAGSGSSAGIPTTAAIQDVVLATVGGNVTVDSMARRVLAVTNNAEVKSAVSADISARVAVNAVQHFTDIEKGIGRANLGLDTILDLGDPIDYVAAYKLSRDAA